MEELKEDDPFKKLREAEALTMNRRKVRLDILQVFLNHGYSLNAGRWFLNGANALKDLTPRDKG